MDDVAPLVDLDRFPLDRPGTDAYRDLVAASQAMHETEGACNLEGFLRPQALTRLQDEADSLLENGYRKSYMRNAFFSRDDPSLATDHPRRRFWRADSLQIADDQIGPDTLIRQLYLWRPLIDFVAAVEGCDTLYPMADEFQALNIIAHDDGEGLPWHYDTNNFTVTLLLRAPDAGGAFAFAPDMRDDDDPEMTAVRRVFAGDPDLVHRPWRDAGTLTLFRGRRSLHRVDPVEGNTPRVTAILTYDQAPDCVAGPERNIIIYGPRVEAIYRERGVVP